MRGGRGGAGGQQNRRRTDDSQKVSVGIDARTNSLIVTAPENLFKEIEQLVEQLDVESVSSNESMRIISLKGSNSTAIQQALTQIIGPENVKSSKPPTNLTGSSTVAGSAGRSNSGRSNQSLNQLPAGNQQMGFPGMDPRMMQQMMQGGGSSRGSRGSSRGGGSGFPGGGFGGR